MGKETDTNQIDGLFTVSFLDFAKAARDLTPDSRLWSVLAIFKENARSYGLKSTDIFQAVYDDPTGAEYWQGWFEMPGLTFEEFIHLAAVHVASEFSETLDPESNDYGQAVVEKYLVSRDNLIIKLKEMTDTARLGDTLKFEGNIEALLQLTTYSDPALEWAQGKSYRVAKALRGAKLNPRETLIWFADNPEGVELLPKSFINWRKTL